MLKDAFFRWPWEMSLVPAVEYMKPIFLASPELARYETDPKEGPLSEYIALICRQWDISPAWVLVSLQREQSLLTKKCETEEARVKALKAASGFVGRDVGRADLPGYYGIRAQVYRCVEQTAWNMGIIGSDCWREWLRTRKTVNRYRPGIRLKVEGVPESIICLNKDAQGWGDYAPITAGEYMQLSYTPHWHVLKANEDIAKKFAAQFI